MAAKKRTARAAARLDDAERSLYAGFAGAAAAVSQLYTAAAQQQRAAHAAGECAALDRALEATAGRHAAALAAGEPAAAAALAELAELLRDEREEAESAFHAATEGNDHLQHPQTQRHSQQPHFQQQHGEGYGHCHRHQLLQQQLIQQQQQQLRQPHQQAPPKVGHIPPPLAQQAQHARHAQPLPPGVAVAAAGGAIATARMGPDDME